MMTLRLKTLSVMTSCVVPNIVYAECPDFYIVMLSHYAKWCYAECRDAIWLEPQT